jgi:hypothetical protein
MLVPLQVKDQAAASVLATITVLSDPNRPSPAVLLMRTLRFFIVGWPGRAGSPAPNCNDASN